MQTMRLTSRLKKGFKVILGPLLPFIRSLRTLPARQHAKRYASSLYIQKTGLSVCYLTSDFPNRPPLRTEITHGGAIKLTFLAESFPHTYPQASLLYSVSSIDHPGKSEIVRMAKKRGLKIVLNQNGVAYPGWHGPGWEISNKKQLETYQLADYIIYQSQFCKASAEIYLGKSPMPSSILYNPVDIDFFSPMKKRPQRRVPILLLGGNQFSAYRFEVAVETLKHVLQHLPDTKLIITGRLWGENQLIAKEQADLLVKKLGIEPANIEYTGPYSQEYALKIFQTADILIHTQFQDASPGLVGEALACGLPVVYSASGGTPELVGPEAGIGIPAEQSWEIINLPDPQKMAEGVLKVWENYSFYAKAARERAVEKLALSTYAQEHHAIFSRILE